MAEARVITFCTHVGYIKSYPTDNKPAPKGTWLGSHDPLYILGKTNGKLYVAYQIKLLPVTLNDLRDNFCHLKPHIPHEM